MNNEELAVQIWRLLESKPDIIDRLEILSNLIGDCIELYPTQDQLRVLEKVILEIQRKLEIQ